MVALDKADRVLLDAVQDNCRIGLDVLAERSGLSAPSVQRRLRKLREAGLIQREVAVVSPEKAGYPMSFVVMVELEREALLQLEEFKRRVKAESQVQQCFYVTGEADFILVCTARDMSDFEELTHRLFFDDSNVRRFRTSVVMGRTKTGQRIPT